MAQVSFPILCLEIDAPTSEIDKILCSPAVPGWENGMLPTQITFSAARNPMVVTLLLLLIILILFNFRNYQRIFVNIKHGLIDVRERENAFDETSANETRTFMLLIIQLCICQALLIFSWFTQGAVNNGFTPINITLALLTALTCGYYIFRAAAYATVGWVFGGNTRMKMWLRGFNAAEGVLSVAVIFPAIVAVFYPQYCHSTVIIALFFLIIARICFIIKGFRIFYTNFFSLLYFILYLCTLEIIPLLIVYAEADFLCKLYY